METLLVWPAERILPHSVMERKSHMYLHGAVSVRRASEEREDSLVLECSGIGCSVARITRRSHELQGFMLPPMAGAADLSTSACRSFPWHWRTFVIYCCLVVTVVHPSAAWQHRAHRFWTRLAQSLKRPRSFALRALLGPECLP